MRNQSVIRVILFLGIGFFVQSPAVLQTFNRTVPNVVAPAELQVNTYTGNLFYQRHELQIQSIGPDLEIYFSYNSHNTTLNFGYGYGWTMNYNVLYESLPDTIVIHREDGRRDTFPNMLGVYIAPPGVFDTLILYDGDKYLLQSKYGLEYHFEDPTHKRMTKKVDRNGNTLTLSYANGLPSLVADATGRILEYTFNEGLLVQITDPNAAPPRILTYGYDGGQNQVSATDPLGYEVGYSFNIDRNLVQVKNKRGHTFNIEYMDSGRVSEILSEQTELAMSYVPGSQGMATELVNGSYQVSTFDFDGLGRNTQVASACCGYFSGYTYDAENNITSVVNAIGNTNLITCDDRGNRTSIRSPLGIPVWYTYDPVFNQVLTVTDTFFNITAYTYDGNGNRIMTTRPEGVVEEFTYDPLGNMLTSEDGEGYITTYVYDPFGYMIEVHYPIGSEYFTYDLVGNLLTHTDANNNISTYSYDPLNRLISEVDALGNTTTYSYDPIGNQIAMTNARGFTTHYFYDSYDRLIREVSPFRTATHYEYDARGNLVKMIDPNGHETNYIYDNLNRLIGLEDALFYVSNYSYDPVGNRISETDANGHSIRYSYDPLNRLISDTSAVDEITHYAYGLTGNQIATLLPNGNQLNYVYDGLDRIYWHYDNLGTIAEYSYDHNSNLLTETDALGQITEFRYDSMNRLIEQIDPKDDTLYYFYDLNGNLTEMIDMEGRLTTYTYDQLNRRITMLDALSNLTTYEYDPVGNLIRVTDANGNATQYSYDPLNRLILETYADHSTKRFDYDPAGNLDARRDNNGNVTTYSYDPLNRLINRDYPGPNDDEFTYDPIGLMATAQNLDAFIDFTYDPSNRLLSETLNGRTTSYIYDYVDGGRTIIYPGGRLIQERLNENYQIDTIRELASDLILYEYDTLRRVIGFECAMNGTSSQYAYDNNNRVVNVDHQPGIATFNYEYDKMNNRLSEEKLHDPIGSERYQYDPLDRLVIFQKGPLIGGEIPAPVSQSDYEYDPVGNRIETSINGLVTPYVSNNMNAYLQIGEAQNTHDLNGNLRADDLRTCVYDFENRLIEVEQGLLITQYSRDPLGRRLNKLSEQEIVNFYYDGDRVIEERSGMDITLATYVYGSGIDEVVNMQRGGGMYFYHQNALGSVVAISDLVGNVLERYSYDAYGSVEMTDAIFNLIPESFIGNPFFFTGRRLDTETGLYYYRARHYDPEHGRFLQRDPLGYVDGMNLYEYVGSNPPNFMDPMGSDIIYENQRYNSTNIDQLRVALSKYSISKYHLNGIMDHARRDGVMYYLTIAGSEDVKLEKNKPNTLLDFLSCEEEESCEESFGTVARRCKHNSRLVCLEDGDIYPSENYTASGEIKEPAFELSEWDKGQHETPWEGPRYGFHTFPIKLAGWLTVRIPEVYCYR